MQAVMDLASATIVTKVTAIAPPVANIFVQIPAIMVDIARVGCDVTPVASQFLFGRTVSLVVTIIARVYIAIFDVPVQVAPVATDVPRILANVTSIFLNVRWR